jgi:flagellar basal body-associated protein FliL
MLPIITSSFLIFLLLVTAPFSVVNASSLPSQQERFSGMRGTFKEKMDESGGASSGFLFKKSEPEAKQEEQEAVNDNSSYFRLHTFVVNILDQRYQDKIQLLTLEVYCEINDEAYRYLIDDHLPAIKDTIITHVSGLDRQQIQTQKQKKELQQILTTKVSTLIKQLTGKTIVNDLYLTRFLIQ